MNKATKADCPDGSSPRSLENSLEGHKSLRSSVGGRLASPAWRRSRGADRAVVESFALTKGMGVAFVNLEDREKGIFHT